MNNIANKKEKENFSIVKRAKSFAHAFRGLKIFIATTHNARIQLVIALIVLAAGIYFHINITEWLAIIIVIGLVLLSETFNTAIEIDIDLTSPDFHPYAKDTKDVAAAAVLLASLTALIVGLVIFIPKILALLTN